MGNDSHGFYTYIQIKLEMCAFFHKLSQLIVNGDLNTIGLILGFIGGILITLYGMPSIGVLNEGSYIEIEITETMRRYDRISHIGLFFVMIGFLLQLIATVNNQ